MDSPKESNDLFSKMRLRMWEAHASFEIYRAIQYSKGIDVHGRENAERNASVINRYKEFFIPVMRSLFANSTLGLWMFFDKEQNLGYRALLKEMKLVTNHQVYENLKSEIESKLLGYESVIEKIKQIRHEEIAHVSTNISTQGDEDEKRLNIEDVDKLYKVTQEIFNLLSGHFEDSTTMFPLDDQEARGEVDALMRDLHLGFEEYKRIIHKRYFPEDPESKI